MLAGSLDFSSLAHERRYSGGMDLVSQSLVSLSVSFPFSHAFGQGWQRSRGTKGGRRRNAKKWKAKNHGQPATESRAKNRRHVVDWWGVKRHGDPPRSLLRLITTELRFIFLLIWLDVWTSAAKASATRKINVPYAREIVFSASANASASFRAWDPKRIFNVSRPNSYLSSLNQKKRRSDEWKVRSVCVTDRESEGERGRTLGALCFLVIFSVVPGCDDWLAEENSLGRWKQGKLDASSKWIKWLSYLLIATTQLLHATQTNFRRPTLFETVTDDTWSF